jgi:hypothetical protein
MNAIMDLTQTYVNPREEAVTDLSLAFVNHKEAIVENIEYFHKLIGRKVSIHSLEKILVFISEMKYPISTREELISILGKGFSISDIDVILSNANGLSQLIDIITDHSNYR